MAGIKEAIEKIDEPTAILCPQCKAFVFDEKNITWNSKATALICPVCLKEFAWENNEYYPCP